MDKSKILKCKMVWGTQYNIMEESPTTIDKT